MQNINYDLIKLLHTTLDTVWRLEKYYVADAKKVKCHSTPALEKMLAQQRKQMTTLAKEIELRAKAEVFN
ncbi:hypothetical protein HY629_02305 [Candidatus Uhrbacteria bacterium]|nr:hypothetical protein [Candidatus Uhrbacteria bacterium]